MAVFLLSKALLEFLKDIMGLLIKVKDHAKCNIDQRQIKEKKRGKS